MTDTTTSPETGPVDAAPLSFDQGVSAIEGLLNDDPETDHVETEVAPSNEASDLPEGEEGDEELVLDDVELDEAAEVEAAAPPAITDDTEVELEDGTKISIGQLKRNNLFQRDYSKKTEELARFKEAEEAKIQALRSEAENEIRQQREFILGYAQQFMPQPPSKAMIDEKSPDYDPIGYSIEKARYDEQMQHLQSIWQQKEQETQAEQQRQAEEAKAFVAEQQQKLLAVLPHLKDEARREAFRKDVKDIGIGLYGVTEQEVNQINDHRFMRILHDAIQYQKAKAKAAAVQKQVAAKPKLVQQQRMAPQAVQERDRQGRFAQLRKEGSIDAAAKAIEALL